MRNRDGQCGRGRHRADKRQGQKLLYIVVLPKLMMVLNFAAIVLAIIGTLNPVVVAPVHNAGSVLVIANSAILLRYRAKT